MQTVKPAAPGGKHRSYTRLDGQFSRIPFGTLHIGRIAQMRKPLLPNHLKVEDGFPDSKCLQQNRFSAHAVYPLTLQNELLGVMVLFSKMQPTDEYCFRLIDA